MTTEKDKSRTIFNLATEQDKLDRETTKLELEIQQLKRPFWKTPTGIAVLLSAFVALAGTGVQYLNSTVEKKLAEIERLEIKAATLKLAEEKTQAEEDLARVKEEQEQVADDKMRLEKQYATLTEFFRENPNIQNAQALIETIHNAHYPLSFRRNFNERDNLTAKVSGALSKNGALAVTVAVTGNAKTDKVNLKGYVITIKDIQTGKQLETFSTEKLTATGKRVFGALSIFEWKKTFTFKVEATVINRIFLDSQLSISASQ